jgi:prefoldin beta subunit
MAEHECDCGHNHEEHSLQDFDETTQRQIQELQILEHNFQQLIMQKQAFKMELDETDFALEELKKAEGEVFRIVGGSIVIKSTKEKIEADLNSKKNLIALRMKTMDSQEQEFSKKIESIRDEVLKKISEKN